ncbi:unnamed protein product, partial [Closterium sp. NIES-53]
RVCSWPWQRATRARPLRLRSPLGSALSATLLRFTSLSPPAQQMTTGASLVALHSQQSQYKSTEPRCLLLQLPS